MEVICERCGTEYEFDDALVSERGTTVQCTNCGLQFKVRREGSTGAEHWLVRTVDGRELSFAALRELQTAIASQDVSREDVLSRGASRPRRLGSIAELEPFFAAAVPPPTVPRNNKTLPPPGLGVPPQGSGRIEVSVAMPLPRPRDPIPPSPDSLADTALRPPKAAVAEPSPTKRAGRPASLPPPPAVGRATTPGLGARALPPLTPPPAPAIHHGASDDTWSVDDQAATAERPRVSPAAAPEAPSPARAAAPTPEPRSVEVIDDPSSDGSLGSLGPQPLGHQPSGVSVMPSLRTPTPPEIRLGSAMDDAFQEPRFTSPYSTRRSGSARWIVGTIVVGGLLFASVVVGRRYLTQGPTPGSQDPKVAALLADGERALAEDDLEGAKEHLDKASALAEKDPRVATALARLAVLRADVAWLRARIAAPTDPDAEAAKREVDVAGARARKAADYAFALTADDPNVLRARVDSLRITSDLAAARALVARLPEQPETWLTQATLELCDDKPAYPAIVQKLEKVRDAKAGGLRVKALLVYALTLSGDRQKAKAVASELGAAAHPHPLAGALRTFAEKGGTLELGAIPDVVPSDPKEAIKLGYAALEKNEPALAEKLFRGALDKLKGDAEASVGLALALSKRNDKVAASKLLEQVLRRDGKHLAAMAAMADLKWELGDKPGAQALYKDVAARGPSPFEERAKERLKAKVASADGPKGPAEPGSSDRVPDDYVWKPDEQPKAPTTGEPAKPPPTSDPPKPEPKPETPPAPPPTPPPGDAPP